MLYSFKGAARLWYYDGDKASSIADFKQQVISLPSNLRDNFATTVLLRKFFVSVHYHKHLETFFFHEKNILLQKAPAGNGTGNY